jgi:hypothetical protein
MTRSAIQCCAAGAVLDNLSHGGALNARKFDSHQEIKAHDLQVVIRLMKFRLGCMRRVLAPVLCPAVGDGIAWLVVLSDGYTVYG